MAPETSPPLEVRRPEWQDLFLEHYEKCGKLVESAKAAGVSYMSVYRKLKHGDPSFNQMFYDRFIASQGPRISKIEDTFLAQMENGEHPPTALRFLERNPLTRARYEPPGLSVRHSGTVKHRHKHEISRKAIRAEMREWSQKQFGSPEREVIDVTPDGESGAEDRRSGGLLRGVAETEAETVPALEEEDLEEVE